MNEELNGTYGGSQTPCTVFVVDGWYCVEGSQNVNKASHPDLELVEGVDVEEVCDIDTFLWKSPINSLEELEEAVIYGAVQRVRPKMMTVMTLIIGLLPIMFGGGTGSQVMKRIAAPMVGGLVTSTILTLLIIPAIYVIWRYLAEVRPRIKREKKQD